MQRGGCERVCGLGGTKKSLDEDHGDLACLGIRHSPGLWRRDTTAACLETQKHQVRGVLEPDQVPRDMRMGCRGAGQGRQGICKESKSKLYSEPALSPMTISVHSLRSFFTHVYYLTYETGAIYQGPLKIFTF